MNRKLMNVAWAVPALSLALALAGCGESNETATNDTQAADQSVSVIKASSERRESDQRARPGEPTTTSSAAKPASAAGAEPDPVDGEGAQLELSMTEYDWGKIHTREALDLEVPFKNVGSTKLRINRISTSCGCTTAKLDKMDFEPGEGDILRITYKPKSTGKRSSKVVTIASNDADQPVQQVKITAWLIEPARIEPSRLQIGQIKAGTEHNATFTIISPDLNMKITDIDDESGLLSFETEDESKPDDPNFPCRKVLRVTLSSDAPTGKLAAPFKVTAKAAVQEGDEPIETVLNGIVLGHIRGDLMTEPRFMRIRDVDRNDDFEVRTLVYSESGTEFNVTKVELEEGMLEDVEATYEPADPVETGRQGWWITLKGNTGNITGAFRGTVVVHTDLPNESGKQIQYNGVIRRTASISRRN